MDLPATAALAPRLLVRDASASTNGELGALAAADPALPDGTVLVTDVQTAGRGRRGRGWWAPPGTSLAISVLLRPRVPPSALPWVPLLAGAAMVRSLRAQGVAAALKWPNDVLIGGRKACGLLAEALPGGAVVVGAGLNHLVPADALPVPTATSLAIEGGPTDPDALVAGWLRAVAELRGPFEAADGDAGAAGLHAEVLSLLETAGRRVRVLQPDAGPVEGVATGLDPFGALLVRTADGVRRITAGDVVHLRYE